MAARAAPHWLARMRFDAQLEELALERLAALDLRGCRQALRALVERLDMAGPEAQRERARLLLLDLLGRINHALYRIDRHGEAFQASRLALIDRFTMCRDAASVRSVFLAALDELLEESDGRRAPLPPLVRRAQAYVHQHYARRLSLSLVAEHLNVSPGHLARSFREALGLTLTGYVHRVRLEHALVLLARGGRRISEVAYLVGYQTYRDFHRNFVKQQKVAPRTMQERSSAAPIPAHASDA